MSTLKHANVSVGGQSIASGVNAGGRAALAALGMAATATLGLMQQAVEAAADAIERARIEQRKREIVALQTEFAVGTRAIERFSENVRTWRLQSKCKSLNTRLERVRQRVSTSGLTLPTSQSIRSVPEGAGSAELAQEVARLEGSLREQEDALRKAITTALETHVANQGVIDSIDRLAALPPPPLETPTDLVGYLEEREALQRTTRNLAALKSFRDSVQHLLSTLPERVSKTTLEVIGHQVAEFARADNESSAQTGHRRIIELIERAKTETLAAEPLRERFEKAREQAEDLVYSELDESDQHRIADDEVVPDAAELAGLEARIAKARARDAAHIADQQRRLAMAATLDALQTLGYETSVVDEATWFKNRSMFISRPEWGGYVVRLTPRDGTMVLFAGRYVDEDSWNDATRPLSPEMEAHYRLRIDDWCSSHLPRLERALRNRGIELNVRDVEDDVHEIQPVARQELGDTMADRIQTRIVEQEKAQDALKGARHA